jgi:hypothetical protein
MSAGKGPLRVTAREGDPLFEVRHLHSGDKCVMHRTRLKSLLNHDWRVTEAA